MKREEPYRARMALVGRDMALWFSLIEVSAAKGGEKDMEKKRMKPPKRRKGAVIHRKGGRGGAIGGRVSGDAGPLSIFVTDRPPIDRM